MEEGWSEIALEPDIKEAIQQLINQPTDTSRHSYGILKRGRIGGALLYGPPGTGKTHLARVLARESKSITICVSTADLESKYVGETEKAIRGLFNLGRMLSPCTIFLDEADGLFRSRKSDDRGWERSRINQLLQEMDGLKKSRSQPFTILATNFPNDLDSAVLRRVPSRIHIGLPSLKVRQQIFQIYLAEEELHTDVNLYHLAESSQGYSGSDIQTVCVQAALICDASTGDDARRRITNTHFDKAFRRSAPTVSKGALAKIKAFSEQYDPAALESRERVDKDCNGTSCLRYEELRTTRGNDYLPRKHTNLPPTGKVEEIEDHADSARLDGSESSYRYFPLQPDSTQIRVLSVLPKGSQLDGFLRCTLRTVDLNDWTTRYRDVLDKVDNTNFPKAPRFRLGFWYQVNTMRYSGADCYCPTKETMEELENFWTNLGLDKEFSFEKNQGFDSRFNWGDYIALSYVWGDVTDRQDILLDGHRFQVAKSLYEALSHLRDAFEIQKRELHVWADAVCINQDDLEERAREVKKMGLIYSQCTSVRAWLGGPPSEIAREMPLVRDFLNSFIDLSSRQTDAESGMNLVTSMKAAYAIKMVSSGLFVSPFWKRIWTIQELALAPTILFHYGQEAFTTEEVLKLFAVYSRLAEKFYFPWQDKPAATDPGTIAATVPAIHRLQRLRPLHDWGYTDKSEPFIDELVRLARDSQSKDPRDKVFGLLALLPNFIAERITPNYDPSFSMQDTFVMFFKSCYEVMGNLDPLARLLIRPSVIPNLPSWALDLDVEHESNDIDAPWVRRRAHEANLGMLRKPLTFSEDDRLLFCEGVVVDAVASLGAVKIPIPSSKSSIHAEPEMPKSRNVVPASDRDWKLTLARVLLQDSFYEFSQSLSALDIPWPDPDVHLWTDDKPDYESFEYNRQWSSYEGTMMVRGAYCRFFQGNEDFNVGEKRLQDYFISSTDPDCSDPAEYAKLANDLVNTLSFKRLCMTENGLLGTAPLYARLGDKIAVLSNCDMPMVLRPNGEHYEVVGSCFVEGLMKRQAAAGIEQGLYQTEKLSLC